MICQYLKMFVRLIFHFSSKAATETIETIYSHGTITRGIITIPHARTMFPLRQRYVVSTHITIVQDAIITEFVVLYFTGVFVDHSNAIAAKAKQIRATTGRHCIE